MRGGRGPELALWLAAAALLFLGARLDPPEARGWRPGPRDPRGLRVVTWNVGAADGEPLLDERVEHVAAVLRELDPDLVALQEVDGLRQAHRLETLLGDGWAKSLARGLGERRVVLLARGGELRELDAPGPAARARAVVWEPADRPAVVLIGAHADAFAPDARNRLLGELADFLARDDLPPARVLAGDLNLDLDLDKRRDLFTPDAHLDVESYGYLTRRLVDAGRGSGSTAEPDRRLDYVLVAGLAVRSAGPWRGRRAGTMDHDPVVADLLPLAD